MTRAAREKALWVLGALCLQPKHRVMRTVILALGVALVVFSLQFLLGFGGPFA